MTFIIYRMSFQKLVYPVSMQNSGMAYNDRRSTRNLLRDMRRIEPEKPRKARLKYELEYSTKLESDLKLSVRYHRSTNSPDLEEEKGRLTHARGYKSGVRLWYRRPLEGSF